MLLYYSSTRRMTAFQSIRRPLIPGAHYCLCSATTMTPLFDDRCGQVEIINAPSTGVVAASGTPVSMGRSFIRSCPNSILINSRFQTVASRVLGESSNISRNFQADSRSRVGSNSLASPGTSS
jgi:hypothetical protein